MDVASHSHSKNVYFFKVGLGGKDEVNRKNWQLKTFSTILEENGHSDVSVEKLNIESSRKKETIIRQ